MSGRLRRVLDMSAGEAAFRARAAWRVQAERLRVSLNPPTWHRRQLERVLAARVVEGPLGAALVAENWSDAGRLFRTALLGRANRFVLNPRDAEALSRHVQERWPDSPAHAARRADDILAGRHQLLGYQRLSFGHEGTVDWHLDPVHDRRAPLRFWADVSFLDPACGDHKIIWEINRHQYFLALGRAYWLTRDPRYAARIVDDIQGWLAANPPLVGINWASMLELGLRSLSWVAATHFLLADMTEGSAEHPSAAAHRDGATGDEWLLDVALGVHRQLSQVERHLSRFFSPNTHLTGEALALYVVGVALPELAASARWTRTGKAILLQEIDAQINGDGGHAELSTCYHRYTLDFYCLAAITAELEGDEAAAGRFRQAVERLRRYMGAFADVDGCVPSIGDEDGGKLWGLSDRDPRDVRDALAVAALVTGTTGSHDVTPALESDDLPEEAIWLGWSVRPAVRQHRSRIEPGISAHSGAALVVHDFRDSGYVVAHTPGGDRLTFDVGHHGFKNGGHSHADALSLTLNLEGRPFLIDPGTATYTMDPALRDRMRHSASHNTVTVDERSSSVPAGPFRWTSRATARLTSTTLNPRFLVAAGTHDGFLPVTHTRAIVFGDDAGWLVADVVDGRTGTIDRHWHFDPDWHVELASSQALRATGPTGERAWLLQEGGEVSLVRGDAARGWCSLRYGALVPTFSAQVRSTGSTGPLATWIGIAEDDAPPTLVRVPVQSRQQTAAYRVVHRAMSALTILHVQTHRELAMVSCEDVRTDAGLLQCTKTRDGTQTIALADGGFASTPALHVTEIECGAPTADISVRLHDDVAELWSTAPPGTLRLRFSSDWRPRRLRLNGRDTVGLFHGGCVDVSATSWNAPPTHVKSPPASTKRNPRSGEIGPLVDAARIARWEGHS